MKESDNPLKSKFSGRTGHQTLAKNGINPTRGWNSLKEQNGVVQLIGIERSNRSVRRFKLLFKDGRVISLSYSHLPVFNYAPDGTLSIQTSEMTILIKGRSLSKLADYFSEEKVLWVKESPSGIDDDAIEVFIDTIEWETAD